MLIGKSTAGTPSAGGDPDEAVSTTVKATCSRIFGRKTMRPTLAYIPLILLMPEFR
jgi:hypothetical protein